MKITGIYTVGFVFLLSPAIVTAGQKCDEQKLLEKVCGSSGGQRPRAFYKGESLDMASFLSLIRKSPEAFENVPKLTATQSKRLHDSVKEMKEAYWSLTSHLSATAKEQVESRLKATIAEPDFTFGSQIAENPAFALSSGPERNRLFIGTAFLVLDEVSEAVRDFAVSHVIASSLNPLNQSMPLVGLVGLDNYSRAKRWDPKLDACFERNISGGVASEAMFADWLASHVLALKLSKLPKDLAADYVVAALRIFCGDLPSKEKLIATHAQDGKIKIAAPYRRDDWRDAIGFQRPYDLSSVPYERILLNLRNPTFFKALGCDELVSVAPDRHAIPHCHIGDDMSVIGTFRPAGPERSVSGK